MPKIHLSTLCLLIISTFFITSPAQSQDQDSVFLQVKLDLQKPISEGWLKPGEEKVGLRGDTRPLSWGSTYIVDDANADGIYEAKIPFQMSSDEITVSLKIKIDGTNNPDDGWQKGRNHVVSLTKSGANEINIAWEDEPEPLKSTFTGNIQMIDDLQSERLKDRPVYIYLPPDYEEDTNRRYPVLYMHDGQNVFDVRAAGREWQVDETAERLIKNNEIEPVIIVGVGNTEDRMDEYTPTKQSWRHVLKRVDNINESSGRLKLYSGVFITPQSDSIKIKAQDNRLLTVIPGGSDWQELVAVNDSTYYQPRSGITLNYPGLTSEMKVREVIATKPSMGGNGDNYLDYLTNIVKPYIDQKYRTKPSPQFTALGGSSLGGLITMYAGLKYKDYGHLLVLSPSVWWDGRVLLTMVNEYSGETGHSVWLYAGTAEGENLVNNTKELRDQLLKNGWRSENLRYVETKDAAHTEQAWADQVENFLIWLDAQFVAE